MSKFGESFLEECGELHIPLIIITLQGLGERRADSIRKVVVTPQKLAVWVAQAASHKKAENIKVLDMRKVVNFCDYFIICSGTSHRHVRGIADGIEDDLLKTAQNVYYKQGLEDGRWAVLDMGNVVAHILEQEAREFYGLDYLWQEARVIDWEK